jgi:NADPH:quinone reductase
VNLLSHIKDGSSASKNSSLLISHHPLPLSPVQPSTCKRHSLLLRLANQSLLGLDQFQNLAQEKSSSKSPLLNVKLSRDLPQFMLTNLIVLPHDTYGRDLGIFIQDHLPYVLGNNIAGTVEELGPDITKYSVGEHIYGQGSPVIPLPDSTGLQEYAILALYASARVPEGFRDDQAATLPVNAGTSFSALFHPNWFNLPPPFSPEAKTFDYASQSLVVIGGGSQVGKLTLQFARNVRIGKIIAIASISNEKELKSLGATHVVDRHSSIIVNEVHAIAGGPDSVTRVYDCVSWTYELAAELVSSTLPSKVLTLHVPDNAIELLKKFGKDKAEAIFVIGDRANWKEHAEQFWGQLENWLKEGKILIPKYRTIEGLDEKLVNEALDSYRDGQAVVQAVVHPQGIVQ